MNTIQNLFIRAKHWHIFLGFVALMCVAIVSMLSSLLSHPEEAFDHLFPFLASMEGMAIFFALWLWSMGGFLNSIVPPFLRMKETFFRISVAFVPLYLPLFGVFFQGLNSIRNVRLILLSYAVIMPMHLFAMFCQFYSWYFASKNLSIVETGKSTSLADYLGYFICLWFFPIGIWIIQPRINRLDMATLSHQSA
jgi:hypothetical protein